MRTPEEIQKEVTGLKEIKPKVRHKSLFGDDHHAAIDLQIEILESQTPERRARMINDGLDPDTEINKFDAVSDALDWLHGDLDSLIETWRELVRE